MAQTRPMITFLAVATCCVVIALAEDRQPFSQESLLIGWHGESYVPDSLSSTKFLQEEVAEDTAYSKEGLRLQVVPVQSPAPVPGRSHTIDVGSTRSGSGSGASRQTPASAKSWIQVLSWQPRLSLFHNMLSGQECDALQAALSSSSNGQPPAGDSNQLLQNVEARITNWTTIPPYHIEGWQLQRGFGPEEQQLHSDFLIDRLSTEDFQRLRTATVMLFLSDDEQEDISSSGKSPDTGGGSSSSSRWSIAFPSARGGTWRGTAEPKDAWPNLAAGQQVQHQLMEAGLQAAAEGKGKRNEWQMLRLSQPGSSPSSNEAGAVCRAAMQPGALRITGFKKGDALLLWNTMADGQTPDTAAAHLACPPDQLPGASIPEKGPWVATTWLHNIPVLPDDVLALAAACVDKNPSCRAWAQDGYCDDAPRFMLGLRGNCRLSCQDCVSCHKPLPGHMAASPASSGGNDEQLDADGTSSVGSDGSSTYVECLYRNMHSLRAAWSSQARGAGVRRARNAIKRELRMQAALASGAFDAAAAAGQLMDSK